MNRLTVVPTTPEEIAESLHDVSAWTIESGLETIKQMIAESYCFRVLDQEGHQRAVYALRAQQLPQGVVAWLIAGQGKLPEGDLTKILLPEIEKQADGADYFAIQTRRPGLMKKLASQGYTLAGAIMVKRLES